MRSLQTVTSRSYDPEVTITRPSNTTAYIAGDVMGVADVSVAANAGSAILTFAEAGPAGGTVVVTAADLLVYVASVPAGMTSFTLHLYDSAPTAILDNAVWTVPAGDRTKWLGKIDIGSPAALGVSGAATLGVQADQVNKQFKLAEGSTSLYGLLVSNGGFTPASGAVKKVRLHAVAL
jgi:hypothetical protein